MSVNSPHPRQWPDGLDSLLLLLSVANDELDYNQLLDVLQATPGYNVAERRVRATLRDAGTRFPAHGHLLMREVDGHVYADLAIYPGDGREEDELAQTVAEWLAAFGARFHVEPDTVPDHYLAILGTLTLAVERWHSEVPLPIRLPGMLSTDAGSPEVAGFEFTFRDEDSPVQRAAISFFTDPDEYRLRLDCVTTLYPIEDLVDRAMDVVLNASRMLATPVDGSSAPPLPSTAAPSPHA